MDDYIDITSFTHHPFYTQFIIEIPDNWMWGTVYNLPLDEMMTVIDNALANGYPVSWGTDVSEKGFSRTKAIGIIPEADLANMDGTEAERWGKLTQKEKDDALYKFDKPGKLRRDDIVTYGAEIDPESVEYLHAHYPEFTPRLMEGDFLKMNLRELFPGAENHRQFSLQYLFADILQGAGEPRSGA